MDEVIRLRDRNEEEVSEEAADAAVCTCGLFDFLILECLTDILQFSGPASRGRGGGIETAVEEPEEAQTLP